MKIYLFVLNKAQDIENIKYCHEFGSCFLRIPQIRRVAQLRRVPGGKRKLENFSSQSMLRVDPTVLSDLKE